MSNQRTTSLLSKICRTLLPVLLVLFALSDELYAQADASSVSVLYPDIREPYRSVFLKIISGIEDGLHGKVRQFPLAESEDLGSLEAQLKEQEIKAVIALGRSGLLAAEKLRRKWPVVVGAVLISANSSMGFSGISLAPDPEVLFDWLSTLAPEVKRVTVIYNREHNEQSIERARESGKLHGLTLNALPAENLREAAALYRKFLNGFTENSEALWLTQDDSILDENALLPVILKEAWDKNLIVFSSTPEHVKKGALFSLYPDNVGMGRSLAAIAVEQSQENRQKLVNIRPLRDLLIAVNLRTAEHLGLKLTSHEKRKFDLVFPSP